MERRDWWVYPWQIDSRVAIWQERFPQYVEIDMVEQFTRHRVWAITVTDPAVQAEDKRNMLVFVPHAHEPAGTAACMSFIEQLLSGKHSDGCPSTLARHEILRQTTLTFIPDGNPYGRARCPEPWWDGARYNNREFINMVFGIGDQRSEDPLKPRWERFKRVSSFTMDQDAPARLGLVYEQLDACTFAEPNRGDPGLAVSRLVERLLALRAYDQVLNLHQTEFEGYADGANCMAMLPSPQPELGEERQAYSMAWGEALLAAWQSVGGRPTPIRPPSDKRERVHRQADSVPWEALQQVAPWLTIEIQNNSPATPAEQQLLLFDTTIWRSIAYLLGEH